MQIPFLHSDVEDDSPTYGTEKYEETDDRELIEARITFTDGDTTTAKGIMNLRTYHYGEVLRVRAVSVDDVEIIDNTPVAPINEETIRSIPADNIRDIEVLDRSTLKLKAEAEINYKEEDGERTYTSVRESSVEQEVVE